MFANPQIACVLGIQKISDLFVVNLSHVVSIKADVEKMSKYLDVRDLDNEADLRIPLVALVALPKQLCTGEGDDTLVRAILG